MKTPTYPYRTRRAFRDIPLRAFFECNGSLWQKVSTRTAVMSWPAGPAHSFYFNKADPCHVETVRA